MGPAPLGTLVSPLAGVADGRPSSLPVWALAWGQPLALTVCTRRWPGRISCLSRMFMWQAGHRAPVAHRLVAVAFLINVAAGCATCMCTASIRPTATITWIRFTSVLFGLTLAWIVIQRFRAVTAQARELMVTLAERVAQKERELDSTYQRLEQLAREQERTVGAHPHPARHARRCRLAHQCGDPPAAVGQGQPGRACCRRCATRWTSSS